MDFISNLKDGYRDLWKAIIRPSREEYEINNLGPKEFSFKGRHYQRTDFQLKNKRGLTLECSHFEPTKRVAKELPCVVYLHGNASSRLEALHTLEVLLPANITLFCFDFGGCGKSEGEYVSLGWYERDDVETIINHLRENGTVSTIGLWGRSMGAVAALMHADRDPCIGGIVADSSFSDLRILTEELIQNRAKVPKFVASPVLALVKKTVKEKARFEFEDLIPINHVSCSFMPALFVAGKSDEYIDPHHTKDLYGKYAGDKNIILVEGDHHSARPQFLLDSIAIFFYNTLLVDLLPKDNEDFNEDNEQVHHHNQQEDNYEEINPELLKSKISKRDYDIQAIPEGGNEEELARIMIEESLKIGGKKECNQDEKKVESKDIPNSSPEKKEEVPKDIPNSSPEKKEEVPKEEDDFEIIE